MMLCLISDPRSESSSTVCLRVSANYLQLSAEVCMKGSLTAWGELFCFCPAARCCSLIGQPVTIRNMVEGGASHTADRGTTSVLCGAHAADGGLGTSSPRQEQGQGQGFILCYTEAEWVNMFPPTEPASAEQTDKLYWSDNSVDLLISCYFLFSFLLRQNKSFKDF